MCQYTFLADIAHKRNNQVLIEKTFQFADLIATSV
jgi:hypothetical protein